MFLTRLLPLVQLKVNVRLNPVLLTSHSDGLRVDWAQHTLVHMFFLMLLVLIVCELLHESSALLHQHAIIQPAQLPIMSQAVFHDHQRHHTCALRFKLIFYRRLVGSTRGLGICAQHLLRVWLPTSVVV